MLRYRKFIDWLSKDSNNVNGVVSNICFLFGDYILEGYSNKNELFANYHQMLLLPLVASLVFFEVLLSISRSEFKTVFPAILREFVLRLFTLLLLSVNYFINWIDFDQFILYWIALYGL